MATTYETSYGFHSDTWIGTQQLGTSVVDYGQGVTVDSSNNIYVTGITYGGLDGNTDLYGSSTQDVFLVKYNSSGNKQWTKQFGTSTWDNGFGVAADSSNNIYVTGNTGGDLDNNTSSGGNDLFLVKYNSSGTKQWTKQLGSSGNDQGRGVTVDSSDNIYVTGLTKGGLDGNSWQGNNDIFLVKYNSSGTKQWTQQLGTLYSDIASGVTVDSSNNLYVTGYTHGDLDGNTNSLTYDLFLIKYNSSGNKQWTKLLGSVEDTGYSGRGLASDSSNNIYITGQTNVLIKYNSSGTKQWTKQLSGSWWSVTVDSNDYIYVTGETTASVSDILLVKYNSSGTKQWSQTFGTDSNDEGLGVTVDSSDNIYITGSTTGGLDGNTNSGQDDIFLLKYNSDGVLQ